MSIAGMVSAGGKVFRRLGKEVDMMGLSMQGSLGVVEGLLPSTLSIKAKGKSPNLGAAGFVAPNCSISGDVTMGNNASVWYGATLRGDGGAVKIGAGSNVQDRASIHAATIGDNVSIGCSARISGATIADRCVVGPNCQVMDGAVLEARSMVASGSTVVAGTKVGAGQLWAGCPAAYSRDLTEAELQHALDYQEDMAELVEAHAFECDQSFADLERRAEEAEWEEKLQSDHYFDPYVPEGRRGEIYNQRQI